MKILSLILIAAAVVFVAIGTSTVVLNGTWQLISPNGLLRLADTALLFTIAVLLYTIVSQKK